VALAVPDAVKPSAAVACPVAIFLTLPESSAALAPPSHASIAQWLALATGESAVLLGPGLSQAAPTAAFLDALLGSLTDDLRALTLTCSTYWLASQPGDRAYKRKQCSPRILVRWPA